MAVTFDKLLQDIRQRRFHPVYLLHGEEPHFIDRISDLLEGTVLTEEEKAFNLTILYGRDADARGIADMAARFPMMAEYQLIIVREAQELSQIDVLLDYVQQPTPSTILVLCHKHQNLDKRRKLGKVLEEKHVVFQSKKIYDSDLPDYIEKLLRSKGFTCTPEAAALMAEHIGNNLSRIDKEVEKLELNLPQGSRVDDEAIRTQVGITREYSLFELQTALAQRNAGRAFRIGKFFTDNPRQTPLFVATGVFYAYFTKVYRLHGAAGQNDKQLAEAIGLKNTYFLNEYKLAARNYPLHKVEDILLLLSEYDLKSKGVGSDRLKEGALMQELIFKILQP